MDPPSHHQVQVGSPQSEDSGNSCHSVKHPMVWLGLQVSSQTAALMIASLATADRQDQVEY